MPKHLIYTGPGGWRILGTADGFAHDYEFERGRPLEVTVADAKALLEGTTRREFAEASAEQVKAEAARLAAEEARKAAEEAAITESGSADEAGPEHKEG